MIEILTVLVIIAILMAMSVQAFSAFKARAERVNCTNNLKSLYIAANAYVQDQRSWPQVDVTTMGDTPAFAQAWINILVPYKIGPPNWICPTAQSILQNPNYQDPKNIRIDYFPTSFDSSPNSPFQWPTHPWFSERGDLHGSGNLIIFANGTVQSLNDVLKGMRVQVAQ